MLSSLLYMLRKKEIINDLGKTPTNAVEFYVKLSIKEKTELEIAHSIMYVRIPYQ